MTDRSDRVVTIVGASSGIGRALALRCGQRGDALVLTARRAELLGELAAEIAAGRKDSPDRTECLTSDVRAASAGRDMVNAAISRFGRIDVIVYAAGWNVPKRSIYEATAESWQSILETNLTGAFGVTSAAVPVMKAQGGGLLVYVSSSGAKRPDQSGAAYQASKGGLMSLTRAMAADFAPTIRVNCILPGAIMTGMSAHLVEEQRRKLAASIPLKRIGEPDDIAQTALFLASPMSAYITGTSILVDGGMTSIIEVPEGL